MLNVPSTQRGRQLAGKFHVMHIAVFVDLNCQLSFHMHRILTGALILQTPLIKQQTQAKLHIRTERFTDRSCSNSFIKKRNKKRQHAYSLQVLGPGRRVRHGHEEAVGQDSEHYEEAEQGGNGLRKVSPRKQVKSGVGQQCSTQRCDGSYNPIKCSH